LELFREVALKAVVRTVLIFAAFALAAAPAVALDNPGSDHSSGTPGASHVPSTVPPSGTTGPSNSEHGTSGPQGPPDNAGGGPPSDVPPSQARALGKTECQKLKSNFGDNKSAFGKCIAAVAKGLQNDKPTKATFKAACDKAGLSHKKKKGQKHSPFSACVIAGAHALND
jgi:hypothetical protein